MTAGKKKAADAAAPKTKEGYHMQENETNGFDEDGWDEVVLVHLTLEAYRRFEKAAAARDVSIRQFVTAAALKELERAERATRIEDEALRQKALTALETIVRDTQGWEILDMPDGTEVTHAVADDGETLHFIELLVGRRELLAEPFSAKKRGIAERECAEWIAGSDLGQRRVSFDCASFLMQADDKAFIRLHINRANEEG